MGLKADAIAWPAVGSDKKTTYGFHMERHYSSYPRDVRDVLVHGVRV